MKLNRRHLLWGGVGALVIAGLGGVGAVYVTESKVASILKRRLAYLKLEETAPHAFARDQVAAYLAKRPSWGRLKYHFNLMRLPHAQPLYLIADPDHRTGRQKFEDQLVQDFLLSTDFFGNGADPSKTVSYVAFYDPMRACGNPFWRPIETSST